MAGRSGSTTAFSQENMVELRAGRVKMGSDRFYPEEQPIREVPVEGFWIDRHPVTVAEFRRFAKATGHVTWAEQAPREEDYPDADADALGRARSSSRRRVARLTSVGPSPVGSPISTSQ
jgi:formylglycine-generating enzyme required for sulfatase activity